MFNSLKYAKTLEGVGFTRKQAETQMEIMAEIVESQLATKQDLKDLGSEVRAEFLAVRNEMNTEFAAVRSEMRTGFLAIRNEMNFKFAEVDARFQQLELRMVTKLGLISVSTTTVAVAVLAWLIKLH